MNILDMIKKISICYAKRLGFKYQREQGCFLVFLFHESVLTNTSGKVDSNLPPPRCLRKLVKSDQDFNTGVLSVGTLGE